MYNNVDYNIDANLVNAEYAGAAADQIEETIEGEQQLAQQQEAEALAAQQKQQEDEESGLARTDELDPRRTDEM